MKRRWWFLALAAAIILGGVVLTVRAVTGRRLREQLRELKLQQTLHEERVRIARDLHDNVGANLAFIITGLHQSAAAAADPAEKSNLDRLRHHTKETIDQLRQTIWAIHKENLTVNDLESKLHRLLLEQNGLANGIKWEVTATGELSAPLSSNQALNTFRIAQEAVTNALRHSGASQLQVTLQADQGQELRLEVEDNGKGFDPQAPPPDEHYGLLNMQARAKGIGASLSIHSEAGSGTAVRLVLPLKQKKD